LSCASIHSLLKPVSDADALALGWSPFPRGIASLSTSRAFMRDPAGRLLAIDLDTGKILWRTTEAMRPLLAGRDRVVALREVEPRVTSVTVLDADDGRQMSTSKPLPLPDWAPSALDDTADFSISAEAAADAVLLKWDAQQRYRGGAAPGREVEEAAQRHAEGRARVDLRTGEVSQAPSGAMPEPSHPRRDEKTVTPLPQDVVEQHDLRGRRFQLVVHRRPEGKVQVVLRAVDPVALRTEWETVVDERPAERPRALRR
jgi:hypothetical protein